MLTESGFGNDALRSVTRLTRSSPIDRHDSEFIFVTFLDTVGHFGSRAISWDLGNIHPLSALFVSHLYNIFLDRSTAIVSRRGPLEIDKVFIPILELRSARLARLV